MAQGALAQRRGVKQRVSLEVKLSGDAADSLDKQGLELRQDWVEQAFPSAMLRKLAEILLAWFKTHRLTRIQNSCSPVNSGQSH